jgi:hypothetical protein
MIVATNCPNCKQDQPVEIKEQRFELYTIFGPGGYAGSDLTDKGFLPVSCTKCGATWELHYKLTHCENLELDEG